MRILLALFAVSWIASLAPAQERLLVGNGTGVELIDRAALTTLAVTQVGTGQVAALAVTVDRRYALVSQMGASRLTGSVAVLDLSQPQMPVVSKTGLNMMVTDLTATFDGKYAFAAGADANTFVPSLLVIDTTATPPQAVTTLKLPSSGQYTNSVATTPDGRTGYVADLGAAAIHVLDLTGPVLKVTKTLPFSSVGTPWSIAVSDDGLRMLVPLSTVNTFLTKLVTVWDISSPTTPIRLPDLSLANNTDSPKPVFEPGNGFAIVVGEPSAVPSTPNVNVVSVHAQTPQILGTLQIGSLKSTFTSPTITRDGLTGWIPTTGSSATQYLEIDLSKPATPKLTGRSVSRSGPIGPVLAFGEVHHSGPVWVGGAAVIRFASPVDAGKTYALGASFATRPGIALGGGRVLPLAADPLLFASRTLPGIFQGFTGQLNTRGQAVATLVVPSIQALRGLSFYVAGIVADPQHASGIARVTNADHIVIQ